MIFLCRLILLLRARSFDGRADSVYALAESALHAYYPKSARVFLNSPPHLDDSIGALCFIFIWDMSSQLYVEFGVTREMWYEYGQAKWLEYSTLGS